MPSLLDLSSFTILELNQLCDTALACERGEHDGELLNYNVANLFYEPSTRTRVSFELAARKLGMAVINLDITRSSTLKGESEFDTCLNLSSMGINNIVFRHQKDYLVHQLSKELPNVNFINAGDGCHAHPSQSLLDLYTIKQNKQNLHDLSIAVVGDIKHSRVAKTLLEGLKIIGVTDIRLSAPKQLLPDVMTIGRAVNSVEEALDGADVVVALRIQNERFQDNLSFSEKEYVHNYCLTMERLKLAKKDVLMMHPGPINHTIEVTSEVVNSERSVVYQQVRNSVFVRMAIYLKFCQPPV